MLKNKPKIFKLLASASMLLVLLCIQANALPLSLTFGENHQASFIYQDGETYLKLGHEHGHSHHHQNDRHHTQQIASIFNGHDGIHTDHFIKINDSQADASISTIQSSTISLDLPVSETKIFSQFTCHLGNKFQIAYQINRIDQNLILRKYSIQFLA